jgi:EAL domain-containing protein (putative c-di-GMP-specific phosphodiesterase class I)
MNQLRIVVMENGPDDPLLAEDHDATMRQLGLIDARTGLPHRDLLLDRLGQATAGVARGGSAFALMVIGTLPATPGMAGPLLEAVMQQFARRLHRLSRRTDSFARLNTSDFAALLPGNPSVAGLMSMGQKIAAEFADRVQVHIGVALCPRHASDADTLLAQARLALEQARQAQVITALFEPRTAVVSAPGCPATAVPPTGEDPRPLFQPVLDLREGRLSRLQISTPGIEQAQADFMPTGLGAPPGQLSRRDLSAHLIASTDTALRCALPWRQQGLVQRLSLPLPGRLLDDPGLAPALLTLLDHHRWPARHFMVEAHAAALAQRGGEAIEVLTRAGVALVINDGRSGLGLHVALAGLDPMAELKFDVGALDLLPRHDQRAAVVRAWIALAAGWNARVVADGVDDLATLAWLGDLGCDGAQGSACGKAMPAEQVKAWCAGHQGQPTSPPPFQPAVNR